MTDEINDWKKTWQQGKSTIVPVKNIDAIKQMAAAKKRNSLYAQYSTIAILTLTMIGVYVFFIVLYPYQNLLSNIGIWIMIISLALRIIIEIYSIIKMNTVRLTENAVQNTQYSINYFSLRKTIHGVITYTIVALYTLGFYLMMPEFSKHAPTLLTIFLCMLYPAGAIVLITQIKKGIKQEMQNIAELVELQKKLQE